MEGDTVPGVSDERKECDEKGGVFVCVVFRGTTEVETGTTTELEFSVWHVVR